MDPKNLAQLDPKLREAYERVMGTQVSKDPLPPPVDPQIAAAPLNPADPPAGLNVTPPANDPPAPVDPPMAQPLDPPASPQSDPVMAKPQNTDQLPPLNTPPPLPPTPSVTQATSSSSYPGSTATPFKKGGKLFPVLIGAAFVVFLALWAFLWINILGVKL